MYKKPVAVATIACLLFLFTYWFKSFLGLNLFDDYSISGYPLFSVLDTQVIEAEPTPGVVVRDSFERTGLLASLRKQWRFHGATMQLSQDTDNVSNRILTVHADHDERWHGNYARFVRVQPGERYEYSIRVNMAQLTGYARASVITYDSSRQAISWNNFKTRVAGHDRWVEMRKTFTIGEGVNYIKFRLTGVGEGAYRFDDFVLNKL